MFKGLLCSRVVIDVSFDAGDAEVVVTMSTKALCTGARSDLVMIMLALVVINGLVGGMIGVGFDMLTGLGIVVVAVPEIDLEIVRVSCVGDVRAGVCTGTAVGSDVTIVTRVGVMVGLLIDLLADVAVDFLTGIGVTMTDQEFIDTRESLTDALRC